MAQAVWSRHAMVLLTSALLPRCFLFPGRPRTRTSFRCTVNWISDSAWTASNMSESKAREEWRANVQLHSHICPFLLTRALLSPETRSTLACGEHVHVLHRVEYTSMFVAVRLRSQKPTCKFVHRGGSSNLGLASPKPCQLRNSQGLL